MESLFTCLPDEAIVHVASFLNYTDLCSLSQTNKKLYQIATDPLVLKGHLLGLVGLLDDNAAFMIPRHEATFNSSSSSSSSFWRKCIHILLDPRKRKSLPITGVRASSTDYRQKIECTLEGTSYYLFWSSTQSKPDHNEYLLYQLLAQPKDIDASGKQIANINAPNSKMPVALVITGIEVTWFAQGSRVIYNPNQMQVSIGAHSEDKFSYTSGIFNVTKTMEPTVFEISPPQLVILDAEKEVYIKLLLLGKNQTEFGGPDNYYHVVRFTRVLGFVLGEDPGLGPTRIPVPNDDDDEW